jgi:tetratricopeptide (TPR) repeat protein
MLHFLWSVGRAVVKNVAGYLLEDNPVVKIGAGICADVYRGWKESRPNEAQRREDLETLASAHAEEVRRHAETVAAEVAPPEVREALTGYLQQIPAVIRRTLTRRDDPSGKSVPAGMRLDSPEAIVPFLPERRPRFKPGDRPPGIGDWELVELLGTGGFGEVWKARNPYVNNAPPAALKFCLDAAARERLLRHEAQVVSQVRAQGRHPGIVTLQHTYLSANPPCLEYEYVDGGDLAGLVLRWYQGKPAFAGTVAWAGKIVCRLAETVGFAHRLRPPVVHRDLKPGNILVQRLGEGKFDLRIADFGIGLIAGEQALEQTHRGSTVSMAPPLTILGSYTPLYASPQQINREPPDPCDDVHALGVIWYQLLIGDLRLGAPTGLWTRTLEKAGMSVAQIELLGECVSASATDRPRDAKDLADRLAVLLPGKQGSQGARLDAGTEHWFQPPPMTPAVVSPPPVASNAVAYYERAEAYRLSGDHDRAIVEYSEAIRLNPAHAGSYSGRGGSFRQKGEHDRAIADCNEAIRLDPSIWQAYYERGETHRLRGNHDRAIADYSEAIRLNPNWAWAYSGRSGSHRGKGDYDRAIADCTLALRLDPNIWQAYYERGEAERLKGEYDRAIADYSEAIRRNPGYAWAFSGRAGAHRGKGDYDRCAADCTEAMRLDPTIWTAYYERGEAHRLRGNHDLAVTDYSEAIRRNPQSAWSYSGRGGSYRQKGEHDRAIADCTEALRLDPSIWTAYYERGASYRQKNNHDQAIRDLTQAIRMRQDFADCYYERGVAFRLKRDFSTAVIDLTEALRLGPGREYIKEQLALAQRGQ